VTQPVAEDLHLDVARVLHEAFEIDAGLSEVGGTEPHHRGKGLVELGRRPADAHADAAPPAVLFSITG
jgi:hypothetical protein